MRNARKIAYNFILYLLIIHVFEKFKLQLLKCLNEKTLQVLHSYHIHRTIIFLLNLTKVLIY